MEDIKLSITDNKGTADINLQGKLSIMTIETIIPELNSAIDKFSEFNFTLENIEQMDLSAMQMLISIKKTLSSEQKKHTFTFRLSEQMQESVTEAGLLQQFN